MFSPKFHSKLPSQWLTSARHLLHIQYCVNITAVGRVKKNTYFYAIFSVFHKNEYLTYLLIWKKLDK